MIKYRIRPGLWPAAKIETVEVTKETGNWVWDSGGKRHARSSAYSQFHDTWVGAHEALLADADQTLANARLGLQRAQGAHSNIKGMKAPA